eukprot:642579-Amphidinium_carterae.1
MAFHPLGEEVAVAAEDGFIGLWKVTSDTGLRKLQGHRGCVLCVAYSIDGKHLASSSSTGEVWVWAADTGHRIQMLGGHADEVCSVTFLPSSPHTLATASACGL